MTDRVYSIMTRCGVLSKQIRQIDIQIESLNMSMLPNGISYDKLNVQSSPTDPMTEYAVRLDELYRKREDLQRQYLEAQGDITLKISWLSDETQKTVLTARFIGHEDFSRIAKELEMSERNMFRLYKKGLSVINEKLVIECQ